MAKGFGAFVRRSWKVIAAGAATLGTLIVGATSLTKDTVDIKKGVVETTSTQIDIDAKKPLVDLYFLRVNNSLIRAKHDSPDLFKDASYLKAPTFLTPILDYAWKATFWESLLERSTTFLCVKSIGQQTISNVDISAKHVALNGFVPITDEKGYTFPNYLSRMLEGQVLQTQVFSTGSMAPGEMRLIPLHESQIDAIDGVSWAVGDVLIPQFAKIQARGFEETVHIRNMEQIPSLDFENVARSNSFTIESTMIGRVPEPATYLVMAGALIVLSLKAFRKH